MESNKLVKKIAKSDYLLSCMFEGWVVYGMFLCRELYRKALIERSVTNDIN